MSCFDCSLDPLRFFFVYFVFFVPFPIDFARFFFLQFRLSAVMWEGGPSNAVSGAVHFCDLLCLRLTARLRQVALFPNPWHSVFAAFCVSPIYCFVFLAYLRFSSPFINVKC